VGMNDYLTKPVDLSVLSDVIEYWTRAKLLGRLPETPAPIKPSSAAAPPEPSPAEAPQPIDAKRLEESSMGIAALREALITTFLSSVGPRLDRLTEAVATNDSHQVEFEAHGLKGMAATIGADACVVIFDRIEQLGHDGLPTDRSLLERARVEVGRTTKYIEGSEFLRKAA